MHDYIAWHIIRKAWRTRGVISIAPCKEIQVHECTGQVQAQSLATDATIEAGFDGLAQGFGFDRVLKTGGTIRFLDYHTFMVSRVNTLTRNVYANTLPLYQIPQNEAGINPEYFCPVLCITAHSVKSP